MCLEDCSNPKMSTACLKISETIMCSHPYKHMPASTLATDEGQQAHGRSQCQQFAWGAWHPSATLGPLS